MKATPLGGTYHVPHGEANYCLLIGVFKAYMEIDPSGKIKKLNKFIATSRMWRRRGL